MYYELCYDFRSGRGLVCLGDESSRFLCVYGSLIHENVFKIL